ncbi:MAG: Fe-S cluster protein [Syntrophobacterales bacterium]|nr:Fe-S cluster protein [Syntrophobacterales bacterium]
MILKSYRKEIFRPECNTRFQSLHCIAHLDQNIEEVIPYLNAELGGYQFTKDPLSVTFKHHGKLITVHPDKIAVNALADEKEAVKVLEWLKELINNIWERRHEIQPKFDGTAEKKPNIVEILKCLPKTNCKKCGLPTCMVFAIQLAEGIRSVEQCPELSSGKKEVLKRYLEPFMRLLEVE